MKNYSQNNEQEIILSFFNGRAGRFLDIGAHDGETLSNTRALVQIGWNGVLVEPHPVHFYKLWELYGGRMGITLVNAAVDSSNNGLVELKFNYEGPAYSSTLSPDKAKEFAANDYRKSFFVPVCGVSELERFGPFNFISLDVEGMEIPILGSAEILLLGCDLICVEFCPKTKPTILNQLQALGFSRIIGETPENIIAARP
jgi:FkbM family methyltransferase